MLFVCSGIPLPHGTTRVLLTRFVTSAHLVRAFKDYRNRDDKLRVGVSKYCPPFCFVYLGFIVSSILLFCSGFCSQFMLMYFFINTGCSVPS